MKLTLLGATLDSSIEHEIKLDNGLGFTAKVILDGEERVFNNLTEVHHLFPSNFSEGIAFESDIHCEGFAPTLKRVESVELTLATEIAERF